MTRRLPDTEHTSRPWRIHEITPDFRVEDETVHTVCHLGWIPTDNGDHELRMAALVKPNGLFGRLYMAGISPFRYLVVYPAMTRQWERAWRDHGHADNLDGATRFREENGEFK
ncbi:DUF2867 domain-containing protein [Nonomuraea sp. NPDC049152]|uniref:DUF2867 domain-containing protein n=1 Tax=Nonomuraea sp. NPDC049152 TaxID=3154350 RepID=UPI0033CE423A